MKKAIGSAFAAVGSILLAIAGLGVLLWLGSLWVYGVAWVSVRTFEYLISAAHIMTAVCILIFLPLAIFRFTRVVSAFGLLASSVLFGVCTWVLGFLVTLQYWGVGGVIIGMIFGIVGIVPLGILAAVFNADWWSAGALVYGLALTYGARVIAMGLMASLERRAATSPGILPGALPAETLLPRPAS